MGIFQKSVIQKHLGNLDKELVEKAFQKFRENYRQNKIERIKELKEGGMRIAKGERNCR